VKVVIHIDTREGDMKSSKDLDADDAYVHLRDIMFRLAVGEYTGVYITTADPIGLLRKQLKKKAEKANE
jgi:hypothetical protein